MRVGMPGRRRRDSTRQELATQTCQERALRLRPALLLGDADTGASRSAQGNFRRVRTEDARQGDPRVCKEIAVVRGRSGARAGNRPLLRERALRTLKLRPLVRTAWRRD